MSLSRRSRRKVSALVLFSVSLHCALHCVACSGSDAEAGAAAPDAAAGGGPTGGASGGDSSGGGARPEPGGNGGASALGDAGPGPIPGDDAGPEPGPGDDAGPAPGPDAAPPGPDPRLATLIDEAAAAVCGALFRCCDDGSVNRYFEPYVYNEALEDFVPRLPPRAEVTAETCPALVAEMLTVVPLGRWVDAAERGLVELVPARVDACLDALGTAACGEGVTTALFDATCFWLNPPAGGDEQRTIFARTATEGGACLPLNDGFGGVFFGTCDPDLAVHVTSRRDRRAKVSAGRRAQSATPAANSRCSSAARASNAATTASAERPSTRPFRSGISVSTSDSTSSATVSTATAMSSSRPAACRDAPTARPAWAPTSASRSPVSRASAPIRSSARAADAGRPAPPSRGRPFPIR